MTEDKQQPRFLLLEEHSEVAESLLYALPRPSLAVRLARHLKRRMGLYLSLLLLSCGIYFMTSYLSQHQQQQVQLLNAVALPGVIRDLDSAEESPEKTTPPDVKELSRQPKIEEKPDASIAGRPEPLPPGYKTEDFMPVEKIKILSHSGQKGVYWMYIKGKIANRTKEAKEFLKINVDYLDAQGNIIASDFTYAAGETPLKRGAEESFFLMTRSQPKIASYQLYLESY